MRFQNLPEFPYAPNYCEIPDGDHHADGWVLRVAWVQ
jgi:haloalkane dehalogenase